MTRFARRSAVQAFRFMAGARHIGKIVVSFEERPIRSEGTYLVTGGLGGVGREVARFLVDEGARCLVLTGRHANEGDEARPFVAELERSGARIVSVSSDVGVEGDVAALLGRIDRELPPLRGVFHLAGILDDGILVKQTWERFERVLLPKALGAWHLHVQTSVPARSPLDHFVLFSSASALLGPPGQGSYAAANAFLGALARRRRSEGLPALCIEWGGWKGLGLAAAGSSKKRAHPADAMMTPAEGISALRDLLGDPEAVEVAVLPPAFVAGLETRPGIRPSPRAASERPRSKVAPAAGFAMLERLSAASLGERLDALRRFVGEHAARVLGLPHAPDGSEPLGDRGLDSLLALELRNVLAASLARTLPATLAFDYPTIDALAGHLAKLLFEATPTVETRVPTSESLEEMSVEELSSLLEAELEKP